MWLGCNFAPLFICVKRVLGEADMGALPLLPCCYVKHWYNRFWWSGPCYRRHMQSYMLRDEEFCMQVRKPQKTLS
jgi:hypothetical protein